MKSTLFTCLAGLLLLGCSGSHLGGEDAGPIGDDAGPIGDDAGPIGDDAGPPVPISCDLSAGERVGEPCFCQGPTTRYGAALYRQSVGIEVWDVSDPREPVLAGQIDERPSSSGGLAIVRDHLISTRNIEPALTIYALDDPLRPTVRSTLPLPDASPGDLAVSGDFAVLVTDGVPSSLVGIDLSDLDAPTEVWRLPLEAQVAAMAIDGDRVFLSMRVTPEGGWVELHDLVTGAFQMTQPVEGEAYAVGLATHRGRLLRAADGSLTVYEIGDGFVEVARLALDELRPTALVVDGDLAVIGGTGLLAVDLTDPLRPRVVGETASASGDVRALSVDEGVAFVSNGNGLSPIELNCR